MTEGEAVFYLREVHNAWGASNLSSEKLAELQAAGLIERRSEPFAEVRLTPEGVRCKEAGRASRHSTPAYTQSKPKPKQKHRRKPNAALPRRWAPLMAG